MGAVVVACVLPFAPPILLLSPPDTPKRLLDMMSSVLCANSPASLASALASRAAMEAASYTCVVVVTVASAPLANLLTHMGKGPAPSA